MLRELISFVTKCEQASEQTYLNTYPLIEHVSLFIDKHIRKYSLVRNIGNL